MKPKSATLTAVFIALAISGHAHAAVDLINDASQAPAFPLVAAGKAAPLIVPDGAPEVVKIAARELASDIEAVTGKKPEILTSANGKSPCIKFSISPKLQNRWEAYQLSATPDTLTISGSDKRGLTYGIFEISKRIGVSPWIWWADVPAPQRPELKLTIGEEPIDQPAVKYRGVFINDEDWGLEPWASKTHEPEVGNIGPKTYARLFTLLLRLRANYIWPGMHPTTTPFHLVPGNAAAADAHAIFVGSSHAEPMLLNNGQEWKGEKKEFNYLTNQKNVFEYWENRVKQRTSGESIFTIGMRGIDDSPIIGPKNQKERIATLEKVFADQRGLLAKYIGKGDATRVPQLFCPYKEVLADYNAGLKVPDDVTLVWPDDNYGYIRRYATPEERKRSGGLGVYYHVSYSGLPFSWLWVDTLPPALTWSEMMRAHEQGAHTLWIVNSGDLKGTERSTEFFLDLAWHADRTDLEAPVRFMKETAARDFGKDHAPAVVDILTRMQAINFTRKNEHLQWFPTMTEYQPTQFNEAEAAQRLKAVGELKRDSDALAAKLPANARDAYYELVGYPVAITEAANSRYLHSELARADQARGRAPKANQEAAEAAQKRILDATAFYNNEVAKGKWRHIVTENGVTPNNWKRFQRDTTTVPPQPAENNVMPAAPPAVTTSVRPQDAKPGDFIEQGRVVSINAGNFTAKKDLSSGAGWKAIPGLGRTGSAVTVLPSTATITSEATPSLDYRFYVSSDAPATLHVRLLPTHPLITDQGLRLSVAIDDGPAIPVAITEGFEPSKGKNTFSPWQLRVLSNSTETSIKLPHKLSPGWHTLRLLAVDTGVVVDKFVIDLGGLSSSYDGPAETRLR
ncbi:MAG: glycosyl hydrolase 115 family protein [Luteolibacter sp.]